MVKYLKYIDCSWINVNFILLIILAAVLCISLFMLLYAPKKRIAVIIAVLSSIAMCLSLYACDQYKNIVQIKTKVCKYKISKVPSTLMNGENRFETTNGNYIIALADKDTKIKTVNDGQDILYTYEVTYKAPYRPYMDNRCTNAINNTKLVIVKEIHY